MVHLVTSGTEDRSVYKNAIEICEKFGLHFYTVQVENKSNVCPLGIRN